MRMSKERDMNRTPTMQEQERKCCANFAVVLWPLLHSRQGSIKSYIRALQAEGFFYNKDRKIVEMWVGLYKGGRAFFLSHPLKRGTKKGPPPRRAREGAGWVC